MKPLSKGDPCRVRLHNSEVVEAVYDEPSAIKRDHWVIVDDVLCRATDHTSEISLPECVRFVGPSCVLLPVGVSV